MLRNSKGTRYILGNSFETLSIQEYGSTYFIKFQGYNRPIQDFNFLEPKLLGIDSTTLPNLYISFLCLQTYFIQRHINSIKKKTWQPKVLKFILTCSVNNFSDGSIIRKNNRFVTLDNVSYIIVQRSCENEKDIYKRGQICPSILKR